MSPGRMQDTRRGRDEDPGVPEALPRILQRIRRDMGVEAIDRLWIFPPLRNGRRERGLVAVSRFLDEGERRRVVTVSYLAHRSGLELSVEPAFSEEGDAPPDLLPRVMDGVVRRAGEDHADPRAVEIGGDAEAFRALLEEFDPDLLEPEPEVPGPDSADGGDEKDETGAVGAASGGPRAGVESSRAEDEASE